MKDSADQVLRVIGLSLAGLAYGIVLRLTGIGLTGAGHGTYLFYVISASPFGIGILLWPCIGGSIPFSRSKLLAGVLVIVLMLHYADVADWWFRRAEYPFDYLMTTWEALPLQITVVSVFYICGQMFIWKTIVRTLYRKSRRDVDVTPCER